MTREGLLVVPLRELFHPVYVPEAIAPGTELVVGGAQRGPRSGGGGTLTLLWPPQAGGEWPAGIAARRVDPDDVEAIGARPLPLMRRGARRYVVSRARHWAAANGHDMSRSRWHGVDSCSRCIGCSRELWVERRGPRFEARGAVLEERCG